MFAAEKQPHGGPSARKTTATPAVAAGVDQVDPEFCIRSVSNQQTMTASSGCAARILRDHITAHRIWAEISLPHRAQEQPGSRLPELEQSLAGEAEGRRKMQRRTEAGRIETTPKERSMPAPDAPEKDE